MIGVGERTLHGRREGGIAGKCVGPGLSLVEGAVDFPSDLTGDEVEHAKVPGDTRHVVEVEVGITVVEVQASHDIPELGVGNALVGSAGGEGGKDSRGAAHVAEVASPDVKQSSEGVFFTEGSGINRVIARVHIADPWGRSDGLSGLYGRRWSGSAGGRCC